MPLPRTQPTNQKSIQNSTFFIQLTSITCSKQQRWHSLYTQTESVYYLKTNCQFQQNNKKKKTNYHYLQHRNNFSIQVNIFLSVNLSWKVSHSPGRFQYYYTPRTIEWRPFEIIFDIVNCHSVVMWVEFSLCETLFYYIFENIT